MLNITSLPTEVLLKSHTYQMVKDREGLCSRCHHLTPLLESCCGMPVEFRGHIYTLAELWGQIEQELIDAAEPDYDAQRKDDEIDFGLGAT